MYIFILLVPPHLQLNINISGISYLTLQKKVVNGMLCKLFHRVINDLLLSFAFVLMCHITTPVSAPKLNEIMQR